MDNNIGLFIQGLQAWYDNIIQSHEQNGCTWIQQSRRLKKEYENDFRKHIKENGGFYAFGYVHNPISKVKYRFLISDIITSDVRTEPPDNTVSPFSDYDKTQGKCKDEKDYKYNTWLKVKTITEINPIDRSIFINDNTKKYLSCLKGNPHFYVLIPDGITDLNLSVAGPVQNDENMYLFNLESQLEDFIIENWENIELTNKYTLLEKDGEIISQQYNTPIGRIDILAKDTTNNTYVIIELKKNQTSDDTVGQITRYMGWVDEDLNPSNPSKGIIIANQIDDKLRYSLKKVQNIDLYLYELSFKLKKDTNGNK